MRCGHEEQSSVRDEGFDSVCAYFLEDCLPFSVFMNDSYPGSLKYGSGTRIRLWIDTKTYRTEQSRGTVDMRGEDERRGDKRRAEYHIRRERKRREEE
jgi:hypothetical protein